MNKFNAVEKTMQQIDSKIQIPLCSHMIGSSPIRPTLDCRDEVSTSFFNLMTSILNIYERFFNQTKA